MSFIPLKNDLRKYVNMDIKINKLSRRSIYEVCVHCLDHILNRLKSSACGKDM